MAEQPSFIQLLDEQINKTLTVVKPLNQIVSSMDIQHPGKVYKITQ